MNPPVQFPGKILMHVQTYSGKAAKYYTSQSQGNFCICISTLINI